jgi:ABC-type branched-subunit amino acid transport system substrate-binding protein
MVSSVGLTSVIGATFVQAAPAEILIGQTAGFTGPVGAGVKETTDGAKIYFNSVNALGGVNGQKIALISLDDKFDPKLAADNAQQLIEEKNVVAMFLTRGTPHTQAIIPLLNKHGIPLVGPSTGAMVLQQPFQKYIFNVRSTYQREAEKAISHLSTLGMTRIAIVHVDDSFGADAVLGAQRGLKEAKLQAVVFEKFDRIKPNFTPIVKQLTTANVQAVLIVGAGLAVADALVALRAEGSAAQIITLSNNASAGFIKSLKGQGRGVIVTQVFPNERSINYPLVKEAQALAKAHGLKTISPAMLEGFTAAKVLVAGLRRAGTKPSREKLQYALEALREFDVGGLKINYSTTVHTGLDFADLSIIDVDEKFKR